MTDEELSESQPKWCEFIRDCSLVKSLEAELITLKEQLTEAVEDQQRYHKREGELSDDLTVAEAEVKRLKINNRVRIKRLIILIGEKNDLKDRLAKAQEHIKVTEKFVRDEDWSDYLSALEEKGLGGSE